MLLSPAWLDPHRVRDALLAALALAPMDGEAQPAPVGPLSAFSVPNYRRFVIGQAVSLVGSWTETVAQVLLVLQLTHSGLWLGLATAARYLPVLLLTPHAGLIVDRADKHTVLLFTQASLAALSLVLGALVLLGAIHLWMVFAIALAFGVLTALDNPNRVEHRAHQLRDGLTYARGAPDILAPLCMMMLIGTFTYEFEVSLPLFARGPLAGGATTYSWLMGAFGGNSTIQLAAAPPTEGE